VISCIAVDDEPMALEIIQRYCAKTGMLDLKALFREPVKAIEYLQHEAVDLMFLDINMPELSGMQLVQTLASPPMVIFTTAYSHYAVESYSLSAIDYLLKPIPFERFLASVHKANNALRNKTNPATNEDDPVIYIKSGPQTFPVKTSEILYLEKDGNYMTVHLANRKLLIRENMGDIFERIPGRDFIRVHKSYIVAIKHITLIETHQLSINNTTIPIGSTYRESLRIRLGII